MLDTLPRPLKRSWSQVTTARTTQLGAPAGHESCRIAVSRHGSPAAGRRARGGTGASTRASVCISAKLLARGALAVTPSACEQDHIVFLRAGLGVPACVPAYFSSAHTYLHILIRAALPVQTGTPLCCRDAHALEALHSTLDLAFYWHVGVANHSADMFGAQLALAAPPR